MDQYLQFSNIRKQRKIRSDIDWEEWQIGLIQLSLIEFCELCCGYICHNWGQSHANRRLSFDRQRLTSMFGTFGSSCNSSVAARTLTGSVCANGTTLTVESLGASWFTYVHWKEISEERDQMVVSKCMGGPRSSSRTKVKSKVKCHWAREERV